jgi:outer membrane immunogenic protein
MPVKAPPVMPAPAPVVPASPWSGCYVGGHGGWASARTSWADPVPDGAIDASLSGQVAKTRVSGALFGGQLGCDFQLGGSMVFGIDGSLSGTTLDDTRVDAFNTAWTLRPRNDWLASVTGRIGFGVNNVLLYARGGIAWADSKFEITNTGIFDGNPSKRRQGWVVGGGAEWMLTPGWSLFVEGDFYTFRATDVSFPGDIINPTPAFTVNTKENIEAIKIGLNYRFGNVFGGGF